MISKTYNFEALYFSIYRNVLSLNEAMGDNAFDKSQLREIVTSIFIAQTQRGIFKPAAHNAFLDALNALLSNISNRSVQQKIYNDIKLLISEQQKILHKETA